MSARLETPPRPRRGSFRRDETAPEPQVLARPEPRRPDEAVQRLGDGLRRRRHRAEGRQRVFAQAGRHAPEARDRTEETPLRGPGRRGALAGEGHRLLAALRIRAAGRRLRRRRRRGAAAPARRLRRRRLRGPRPRRVARHGSPRPRGERFRSTAPLGSLSLEISRRRSSRRTPRPPRGFLRGDDSRGGRRGRRADFHQRRRVVRIRPRAQASSTASRRACRAAR